MNCIRNGCNDAAYAGDETRHIGELQNISIALAMVQIVEEQ